MDRQQTTPSTESRTVNTLPRFPEYRVVRVIGRGGMSTVYEATREGRRFAIKCFDERQLENQQLSKQHFRREAALLACLSHRGLVRVEAASETEDGKPFLVLELVEGESLAKPLEQH